MSKIEINKIREIPINGLFICNAGFEKRSRVIHDNLSYSEESEICVFHLSDSFDINITNFKDMYKFIENVSYSEVEIYYEKPIETYKAIMAFFNLKIKKYSNVYIDITSFTHEHLLIIIAILKKIKKVNLNITIMYITAKDYSYDKCENNEKWLTRGVKGIRSILGYPGYFDPDKKNHLIIEVGFEIERVKKLIEKFEYDLITLCVGSKKESLSEALYVRNRYCCDKIKEYYQNAMILEISLTNLQKTKGILEQYVENYSDEYNHVIVPMNNKISTVSTGLYAIINLNIQLAYVVADEYNKDFYSIIGEYVICEKI
jgi:hypothetical protein